MGIQPNGRLVVAEKHALACFNVLYKHVENAPRCGCRLEEGASFPAFVTHPVCLVGANALEEYEIAAARVRALKFPTP